MNCPLIATDIIIEYRGGIVLIERKFPPLGLAIPGGMAELGLSLEENAIKEAKEETGLDVVLLTPELPLCVHSDPLRDPRRHVISVTYVARGSGILQAGDDAKEAHLYTREQLQGQLDKLVFDHARIMQKYLRRENG